jgi:hypothetical protein
VPSLLVLPHQDRKTERCKDRRTDRHKDVKTERQTDIKIYRQKDRQTNKLPFFNSRKTSLEIVGGLFVLPHQAEAAGQLVSNLGDLSVVGVHGLSPENKIK